MHMQHQFMKSLRRTQSLIGKAQAKCVMMDVEGLALKIQTVEPGLRYGVWIGLITRVRV